MRMSLRLIVSLIVGVTLLSFASAWFQVKASKRGTRQELGKRAQLLAEILEGRVETLFEAHSRGRLEKLVTEFRNREGLMGIAVFDAAANRVANTSGLDGHLSDQLPAISHALTSDATFSGFTTWGGKPVLVYVLPLHDELGVSGGLAIFQDGSFIQTQTSKLWRDAFLRALAQAVFIALVTLLIIRWSIVGPIARTTLWVRGLRTGRRVEDPGLSHLDHGLFKPLAQEVTNLAKSLETARAAAEEEARLRAAGESLWTPERLRVHVQTALQERRLFVVSNREPYMHIRRGKEVAVIVPASGLVTALEPILRACEGTWVAHGAGDADHEATTEHDRLRVPPDEPRYTLRRVWLTKEEEEGYYYGFANEGLWPLCHIAHTRPTFRASDWEYYQTGEPQVCRGSAGGNGRNNRARGTCPGFPLCLVAPPAQRAASGCSRGHLLAHSLAEPAGLWNLSLGTKPVGGVVRSRSRRFSYPGPLQLLFGNRRRRAGGARGLGTLYRQPARPPHPGAAVSDQRCPIGIRRRFPNPLQVGLSGTCAPCSKNWAWKPLSWVLAWTVWTTRREFWSVFEASNASWKNIPSIRGSLRLCRSARPAARTSSATRT